MTKELEALKIGIPKLKKLYENSEVNKLVIVCENICLFHNSLGISIPILNEKIERFETITINGIIFKKEVLE